MTGGVSEMGGGFWVEFLVVEIGGKQGKQIELQEEEDGLKK